MIQVLTARNFSELLDVQGWSPSRVLARNIDNTAFIWIDLSSPENILQIPSDWLAISGVAQILNKPIIPSTPAQVGAEPANINIQEHILSQHAPLATSVRYTQGTPSTTWTIIHNLNKYPNVVVVDSAGTFFSMFGDVEYPNMNTAVLHFSLGFVGDAYLN